MSDKQVVAANVLISQLQDELRAMNTAGIRLQQAYLAERGKVVLLTRALEVFGRHRDDCDFLTRTDLSDQCTCGFAEIVTPDTPPADASPSIIIPGA